MVAIWDLEGKFIQSIEKRESFSTENKTFLIAARGKQFDNTIKRLETQDIQFLSPIGLWDESGNPLTMVGNINRYNSRSKFFPFISNLTKNSPKAALKEDNQVERLDSIQASEVQFPYLITLAFNAQNGVSVRRKGHIISLYDKHGKQQSVLQDLNHRDLIYQDYHSFQTFGTTQISSTGERVPD